MWLIFAASVIILAITLYLYSRKTRVRPLYMKGRHVLVTGGSSGIGLSVAKCALTRGAKCVTIVARNLNRLEAAAQQLQSIISDPSSQKVQIISIDLSKDSEKISSVIEELQKENGVVDFLINCAGTSISARFEDTSPTKFHDMMNANFFGSVFITQALVPQMKERQGGRIVFTSSVAGEFGLFGYTAYSASKYALRGLAESLQMEVAPYNIRVTLAFPPDTDTPGFAEEQKGKPRETLLISESAGLVSPDRVARSIVADCERGRFLCSVGFDGFMLSCLTSGFSPFGDLMDVVLQVLTMVPMRLASLVVLRQFDGIVAKCMEEKKKNKYT